MSAAVFSRRTEEGAMKLLLVEDENKLREALSHLLSGCGYTVDAAADGLSGAEMAATGTYDVIVLDRMLPGLDGVAVLRELREMGLDTPVIFLTAKDSPADKVDGLNAGADDYLVKPFHADELLARLRVLTRRRGREYVGDTVKAAGLVLDPLRGDVRRGQQAFQLTARESALLEVLMRNSGCVVTKDRIMEKVWGYNAEIDFASIDVYIHHLRRKLGLSAIRTVRGIGYYLEDGASNVSESSS